MAVDGTEKAEQCLLVSLHESENGKMNGHAGDINGSTEGCRNEETISKDPSNELQKCAKYGKKNCKFLVSLILNVILIIVVIGIIVLPALLPLKRSAETSLPACSPVPVDWCPDGWIGYRRKCYYFADTERNWTSSKMSCSSFNASLAVIESQDEMDFLRRYKTSADHWIGLQRDLETEPWKWINGRISNNWFQVRGGGECAYIDSIGIASSSCTREEYWICSKPSNKCQQGFTCAP